MAISRFAAEYNAFDYAYGTVSVTPALTVSQGNSATGAGQSVTLAFGNATLSDGSIFNPLSINASLVIGSGANAETVTPSAVSNTTPTVYNSTTFTATLNNLHGPGDLVSSATFGLAEAIIAASANGGGRVVVTPKWYSNFAGNYAAQVTAGRAVIVATKGFTNVAVLDGSGITLSKSYAAASNGSLYTITAVNLY